MLTLEGCRARLDRLRAILATERLDAALLSDPLELYYFLGQPLPPAGDFPAVAMVETDGQVFVLAHRGAEPLIADRYEAYDPHVGYTRNLDNVRALGSLAIEVLEGHDAAAVGYQAEHLPHYLALGLGDALGIMAWQPLDDLIGRLQRAKDPDELALMRTSIASVLAAYDAVSAVIAPGVTELDVLAAGRRAALEAAGEPVFHDGDYQCASAGGPARQRPCAAGELFIVDAWTIYRGYWSDLCRTFAVGEPTELQQSVYDHLAGILREVPERLHPGAKGTELAAWMDARIREHPHLADAGLAHHAGHGVGLRPHTVPDLNAGREGVLTPGDTVSIEPGAYTDALRAGVRVENTFLITETGCELLSEYPLSLTQETAV